MSCSGRIQHIINRLTLCIEPQAVAGRWRVLTRRYLHAGHSRKTVLHQLTSFVDDILIDLLLLTGCTDDQNHIDEVLVKLESRTTSLAQLALHLNETVGQHIGTMDYEVSAIHADAEYDPSIMDPSGDKERIVGTVLATTSLGIERLQKHETNGGKARWEHVVLVRPVVELEPLTTGMGSTTGESLEEMESLSSV